MVTCFSKKKENHSPGFADGASLLILFLYPRPSTGTISLNIRFVLFEVRLRRWLFPPLVRINFPDPVRRKRFAVALWVFNLYLVVDFLRGMLLLLSDKMPRIVTLSADFAGIIKIENNF